MLSTQYRLKLEGICNKIMKGETVSLEDMIWVNKLSSHNSSAARILRQARRKLENPTMQEGDLDDFLNQLDIGGLGNKRYGVSGFNSPDEIVDFFKRSDEENDDNWRRRD